MNFEVLFKGDEGIYIVKKGEFFYTIDIVEDIEPFKSRYVEAFLKFGGFEFVDYTVDYVVLEKIKTVLTKYIGRQI